MLQLSRKPESFGRTVIEALVGGPSGAGLGAWRRRRIVAALQPQGAVAPFDTDALARVARSLLAQPPALAVTMPAMLDTMLRDYSLQAMQDATLACYTELADDRSADDPTRPDR